MKKLLSSLALIALCTPSHAKNNFSTVYYPAEACAEIVSQTYFAQAGGSRQQTLDIMCRDENGKYTGFTVTWPRFSVGVGSGPGTTVNRFDYVADPNTDQMRIEH